MLCNVVWCDRRCGVSVRAGVCYLMCLFVVFVFGWLVLYGVVCCCCVLLLCLCACSCVVDVCAVCGNYCVTLYVVLWVVWCVTRLFNACVFVCE